MKKITRRTFMKVMGTTAAAVGLSACGGSAGSTAASASNAASSTAVSAPAAAEALTFKVAYSESEDSIYGEVINAAFDEIASKRKAAWRLMSTPTTRWAPLPICWSRCAPAHP